MLIVFNREKGAPVTEKQAEIIDQQKETPIQENTTENQNTGISPTKEETVVTENKTEDSIEAVAKILKCWNVAKDIFPFPVFCLDKLLYT
jgi:hypothetical protein